MNLITLNNSTIFICMPYCNKRLPLLFTNKTVSSRKKALLGTSNLLDVGCLRRGWARVHRVCAGLLLRMPRGGPPTGQPYPVPGLSPPPASARTRASGIPPTLTPRPPLSPQIRYDDEDEDEGPQPDPLFEQGAPIPVRMHGSFPPELASIPLEDIDSFYHNQRVSFAIDLRLFFRPGHGWWG